ncbi:Uncharacterised protein [Mycobacteroides abscessus subsp. massiliense]|uniref:hypothetical protein n=1 Tax=Mycobacteroides abscessus TaxID=36809 RepID=UPI0009A78A34|nr:hypothetical protein [Mycobacteroides abscessus]SKT55227.1 Uncharacterised protein [Mycobacteroides abscessus subsp. massiliense]
MVEDGDQFMVLFLAVGVMAGLLWLVGWIIYREIDVARWKARSRREREAAKRADEARVVQERIQYLDTLHEFGLTESEAEHHPEIVEARVRQSIIGQRCTTVGL